jgi:Spy/CpxP family protein refolding chaperone
MWMWLRDLWKGTLSMKKLFSFVLGGLLLIGAATFGVQTGSASAADHHDKNHWRNGKKHHHRHHSHHRHHKNKLSY